MNEREQSTPADLGTTRIANEVFATIAGLAATEVDGIMGMSGGIAGGIAEALGRRNFSRGVKIEVGEEEAAIDLYVIVKYGARIPDIAWEVQEKVKKAVESMTGYRVVRVNVHVQGVNFPHQARGEDDEKDQFTK